MKRLAAPLAAAVLLVCAAAGLSSAVSDDYCFVGGPAASEEFDGTSSSPIILWPPGRQCRYETASGKVTTDDLGDIAGFAIVLAGGALAVFRRSRHTWAALIVLGLAGLFSVELGGQSMVLAMILGSGVALAATRSVVATATAAGVLIAGSIPYFWNGSTIGWAVLLALVTFAGRVLDAADERVVRYFTTDPRAA